ncbi:MAG: hypothetical protein H0V01_09480 [Bacteroidetes bacterium]|nr:hypothetical protein [Bacteroidota bacterium]HET6243028.1 hypothetical protein [Bacteroidia bacterium]
MRTIKTSLFAITAIAFLATATSCKKTVTPKKLDGEWKVTSGKTIYNSTNSGTTTTTTYEFDGEKEKITYSYVGSVPVTNDKTVSFSFDKKAGTYTKVTVATENDKDEDVSFYSRAQNISGNYTYNFEGYFDRIIKEVSTTTEKGTFTITGGTGEIEKNTQIVLTETSNVSDANSTFTYFVAGGSTPLTITDRYEQSYGSGNNYKALEASSSLTSSNTGLSSTATILNVSSLKKGVMEVNFTNSNTYVSGATTTSYTSESNWTLTEQ